MKNKLSTIISAVCPIWVLFFFCLGSSSAQVVSNDLKAIGFNGNITIGVSNITAFASYFTLNGGAVDLEFHFGLDDPRNGIHLGLPMPQPDGQIYIRFNDLGYEMEDTLSFIVTENFQGATIRHYVFNTGNYFPESGGPIRTCPHSISCTGSALLLIFDFDEIILDPSSSTPVRIQIPSIGLDITTIPGAYFVEKNALVIRFSPVLDCNQMMLGTSIITINGFSCYYVDGQLTCPPWTEAPDNLSENCSPYFNECLNDLVSLLSEAQYSLPCQQWMTFGPCTTSESIYRSGKVAIGTEHGVLNKTLTVKNGIITDKVKITDSGWADHVFESDYPLLPLETVNAYIAKFGHLPGIPSGEVIESSGGFELGEVTVMHQEKIEEIFLHLISLTQEVKELEAFLAIFEHFNKVQVK